MIVFTDANGKKGIFNQCVEFGEDGNVWSTTKNAKILMHLSKEGVRRYLDTKGFEYREFI